MWRCSGTQNLRGFGLKCTLGTLRSEANMQLRWGDACYGGDSSSVQPHLWLNSCYQLSWGGVRLGALHKVQGREPKVFLKPYYCYHFHSYYSYYHCCCSVIITIITINITIVIITVVSGKGFEGPCPSEEEVL